MQIKGEPQAFISKEGKEFINLYASLGERAEIFLPRQIFDNLQSFVKLCYEEPDDPSRQQAEINRYILKFREDIPGYTDVSLMLLPHNNSKAFEYSSNRGKFIKKLNNFLDTESINETLKKLLKNIRDNHDFSVGTPPVTASQIDFMSQIQLGDQISNLRKYRDVIGVNGDVNEGHWNYLMDTLEQMISQSSHYTTKSEINDFLHRSQWTVNFKGLNGLIRTVVSGNADLAVDLLRGEVFGKNSVAVLDSPEADKLYEMMNEDQTSIFIVKVKNMRKNHYSGDKWFKLLTRLIIVDDSKESRSSNTSLVFCFHNGIINTLNKVHTKKLGVPANTQLNLRLILENVNAKYLTEFRTKIENHIDTYCKELETIKAEQLGNSKDEEKNIDLFKLDDFSKQIIKDKYSLQKLRDFIFFLENCHKTDNRHEQTRELIEEFETRLKEYLYSGNEHVKVVSVLEGGGRKQINTYGEYLLQRKFKGIDKNIVKRCQVILDIIPNNYERTLNNHFHKNFGVNLFLEKYQEYITKQDNESDNKGRFANFLIDLGIYEKYIALSVENQDIVKDFISSLGNIDKTSVSDSVQMIIRDLLFNNNQRPKPYIIYNAAQSWEYKDLFPDDRFDLNPFDIEVENISNGRIAYDRLVGRLSRIKATLALFDDSGNLWDLFCQNTTIVINDPNNPTGYSDFNTEELSNFLKFMNSGKITLFLDEAYADSVKIEDSKMPKWRTISRYIMNNVASYSKVSAVASLSTTKNLGATGDRIGALSFTPEAYDVSVFVRQKNGINHGNNNSILILNNVLDCAQSAQKIKNMLEAKLPKNASRYKIKQALVDFILRQVEETRKGNEHSKKVRQLNKLAEFEGSPLHIFLLEELVALDKLDVLGLPDDFKYGDEPFFVFYQKQLVKKLNEFRVNKNFRSESLKRLNIAKDVAGNIIEKNNIKGIDLIPSDGSYLFNMMIRDNVSYTDLMLFCRELALNRGIAAIPYSTGIVRFSLGGFLDGTAQSYRIYRKELEDCFTIFINYWINFKCKRLSEESKGIETEDILNGIFGYDKDRELIDSVISEYPESSSFEKDRASELKINDIRSLYHLAPELSGVSITTIDRSDNSVIELHGDKIGSCRDIYAFIKSSAFTKVYENLLAQVYKNIPALNGLDFNTVASRYSKAVLLKFITNKKTFQPNNYVLDHPEEKNIMREILIEMENLLFSDSKVKILAVDASASLNQDKSKLEGINSIIKKYVREILLHFNLPFEQESIEPSRQEIIKVAKEKFEEITGIKVRDINLNIWVDEFIRKLRSNAEFADIKLSQSSIGYILDVLANRVTEAELSICDKILYLYLLNNDDSFHGLIIKKLKFFNNKIEAREDGEIKMFTEEFVNEIMAEQLNDITDYILRKKDIKIGEADIYGVSRKVVRFFISLIKRTKGTDYYSRYTHTLIRVVETEFKKQNSSVNEMVQHGISIYRSFDMDNKSLDKFNKGEIKWINELMSKCGVISSEQPVQEHTRIATDAKKREYPFHKIDRVESRKKIAKESKNVKGEKDYIKLLDARPDSSFFNSRLARFVKNMDPEDYRCKIVKHGLVKELVVFQKGYMKYLTDNYRLNYTEYISIYDIKNFVPDVISILGAPEKLISFPQIGYFDIKGPNGNIKTIVTPLKQKADYFGDVKKPRLTVINEKVKELGGSPRHGSLFAVEENDGTIFGIEICGDSGVGKSEMIAAFILKWLKNNLEGIRSIKMIAGDMFHEFQDAEGNLYGIGTEVGDFSRTTDFDPDYIKYYKYLFESSADSNVEDLNSRSTVSGLCDITMPYKIDLMLTASNYSKEEAGITRVDNAENFLMYIDSHGERKEKATSQDGPNFQRTLKRYTADKNIIDVLSKHGNYLDTILDWEFDEKDRVFYLSSSFKIIDKIDIEEIIYKIFIGKKFSINEVEYTIKETSFDMIQNRFFSKCETDNDVLVDIKLDRKIFSSIFDSLASTPGGQPFIAEEGQVDIVKDLTNCLKGGKSGKGKAKNIQCGILSTEIGKKGKEITGPQKAALDLKRLLQEVRNLNPEINQNKNKVKKLILDKYAHIFNGEMNSSELWRYNFYIYQLENMRKADFRCMNDVNKKVDLSNLVDFVHGKKEDKFNPLLVTPNLNLEITSFSETFKELMSLPNYPDFAEEFMENVDKVFIAEGYSEETKVNNMIIQLLLMDRYINIEDIARGTVIEKVNRETIAAAKYAVDKYLNSLQLKKVPEKKK